MVLQTEYLLDWSLLLFARRGIWVDYKRALDHSHLDMLVVSPVKPGANGQRVTDSTILYTLQPPSQASAFLDFTLQERCISSTNEDTPSKHGSH